MKISVILKKLKNSTEYFHFPKGPVVKSKLSEMQKQVRLQSGRNEVHLTSCLDWCDPTHWGNSCVWKRGAASPCGSQPSEETWRDRYSRTHAVLQWDIGAYPNVINGNFSRTSFSYNSLEHNLEAGRKSSRVNWASWCKQCKDFQFSVNCSLKSVCVCVHAHAHVPYCTWYTSVDHMALVLEISI